jgi:hypothetical protein
VLAVSTLGANRVRRFADAQSSGVAALLERPPSFRYAGFDLTTLDEAHRVGEDCLEVANGQRKIVRLYQDGTLLARLAADSTFLGWGQDQSAFQRNPRLNPVAVAEAHLAFVHLYSALIPHLAYVPEAVIFNMELEGAQVGTHRLYLTAWYKQGIQAVYDPERYSAHGARLHVTQDLAAKLVRNSPNAAAYRLLVKFYDFFDMAPDLIPLVVEGAEGREIDVEQLKAL